MTWNWEQTDWPRYTWDSARLVRAEQQYLVGAGMLLGTAEQMDTHVRQTMLVDWLSAEAMATSEIEAELLDRVSVQSSIRRGLGLKAADTPGKPAEQGIAEMALNVQRTFAEPLTHTSLCAWHAMVTRGRHDLSDIGRYRTHQEAMQVVSGWQHKPTVHFEAPPSARVPDEMTQFIAWFNAASFGGASPIPPLTRAGIAHLYFISIHPFEDGNGRVGRAVAEKALSQGIGQSLASGLSSTILRHKSSYYDALESSNKSLEITEWLAWFAGIIIEAQRRTLSQTRFILDKTKMLDRLHDTLNPRQEKALLRMFEEGPDGFRGGLSAANYIKITHAPHASATRDLADLVAQDALTKHGELRYTRYQLNLPLRPVPRITINERGDVVET